MSVTPLPTPLESWEVLDLLTGLVQKSLVVYEEDEQGHGRYRLLETVRQYGRDRLLEAGEGEAVRGRHLALFLVLAEGAEPNLRGPEQAAWLDRLEREHDNLQAALGWSAAHGQGEAGLRLGRALWWFWEVRGYWSEGREHLAALLALPEAQSRTVVRAKALNAAGDLAECQGDCGAASALHEESLALFQELDNKEGIAWSLYFLGVAASQPIEPGAARPLFEESLAIFRELDNKEGIADSLFWLGRFDESLAIQRELGNKGGIAASLVHLGIAARERGESGAARALFEESLALFQELDHKDGIARSRGWLGTVARDEGDYGTARALFEENLAAFGRLGKKRHVAWSLLELAWVACAQRDVERVRALVEEAYALGQAADIMVQGHLLLEIGDYAPARVRYEQGLAMRFQGGNTHLIPWALLEVGHAAWLQGEPVVTQSRAVEALGLFQAAGDKEGILAALESLAVAALAHGRKERGARLMAAVGAQREALALPGPGWWRRPRERIVEAVCAASLKEAFAAAWAEGRAMSLDQAVEDALSEEKASIHDGA